MGLTVLKIVFAVRIMGRISQYLMFLKCLRQLLINKNLKGMIIVNQATRKFNLLQDMSPLLNLISMTKVLKK